MDPYPPVVTQRNDLNRLHWPDPFLGLDFYLLQDSHHDPVNAFYLSMRKSRPMSGPSTSTLSSPSVSSYVSFSSSSRFNPSRHVDSLSSVCCQRKVGPRVLQTWSYPAFFSLPPSSCNYESCRTRRCFSVLEDIPVDVWPSQFRKKGAPSSLNCVQFLTDRVRSPKSLLLPPT